jgi:hypothetical protein
MTTLTNGPTRIAAIPIPQGCEQVPAVDTGIGMHEMKKITAAISPNKGLAERAFFAISFTVCKPMATSEVATANYTRAQLKGRMPSEMCMVFINAAILILAAAGFHWSGHQCSMNFNNNQPGEDLAKETAATHRSDGCITFLDPEITEVWGILTEWMAYARLSQELGYKGRCFAATQEVA